MAPSNLPRKRFYRARAHSNPLSDSHFPVPLSPAEFDYSEHFPLSKKLKTVPAKTETETLDSNKNPEATQTETLESTEISQSTETETLESKRNPEATERETLDSNENGPHNQFAETRALTAIEALDSKDNGQDDRLSERRALREQNCRPPILKDADGKAMKIRFADIGCGFGGLLVSLSTIFPTKLMIGMELRDKVSEYVKERILALRKNNPGQYENISVVRTNSMKYLPNYFEKGQLEKMFFLFPDPHFKEKNHRRRVISVPLLAEYAYALEVGGLLYTVTDVEELGQWMKSCLDSHPLFEEVSDEELKADPVVELLTSATEEGKKVARNGGSTYQSVYRRIASAS
eukprot:TRINITY_DN8947_c0_g1_i1.p1 TRINITY_DN8947_c0_g1~~TRINITY_DN8947_c0_g1_i1.p1  ORF type:complete len:347 (-),score=40.00 TRINITY_DN8947_c0_g1_i1:287-1327(-)